MAVTMPRGGAIDPEFLTTAQVLDLLQIGRTKLWDLVRHGSFPAYRIGSGPNVPLRYRRSEIVAWLENQRVESVHELGSSAGKP
jgi:predicted DNA-binding transcriptional regulator AlpA